MVCYDKIYMGVYRFRLGNEVAMACRGSVGLLKKPKSLNRQNEKS